MSRPWKADRRQRINTQTFPLEQILVTNGMTKHDPATIIYDTESRFDYTVGYVFFKQMKIRKRLVGLQLDGRTLSRFIRASTNRLSGVEVHSDTSPSIKLLSNNRCWSLRIVGLFSTVESKTNETNIMFFAKAFFKCVSQLDSGDVLNSKRLVYSGSTLWKALSIFLFVKKTTSAELELSNLADDDRHWIKIHDNSNESSL